MWFCFSWHKFILFIFCRRQQSVLSRSEWLSHQVPRQGMKKQCPLSPARKLLWVSQAISPEESCLRTARDAFAVVGFTSLQQTPSKSLSLPRALFLIGHQTLASNEKPQTLSNSGCLHRTNHLFVFHLFPFLTQILHWNATERIDLKRRKIQGICST